MSDDEPIRVHTADLALLRAATNEEDVVTLTKEMMDQLGERVREEKARLAVIEETVAKVAYEDRLAVACWVFKHIVAHAQEGGSYRYLIYDRLDFNPDAYVPLQLAGALDVSNHFAIPPDPPHDLPADPGEPQ